jgi:hypothetical protein
MIEQRAIPKLPDNGSATQTPQRDTAKRETFLWETASRNVSRRETSAWIVGEPSVQDLLHDPLVHSLLRRDGLSLQDLQQAIALGRSRLAAAERPAASDAA